MDKNLVKTFAFTKFEQKNDWIRFRLSRNKLDTDPNSRKKNTDPTKFLADYFLCPDPVGVDLPLPYSILISDGNSERHAHVRRKLALF